MIRPQRVFLIWLFVCFDAHALPAQQFGFGVTGGVRTTDDITGPSIEPSPGPFRATSESRRYTIGPTVELGLPLGFGIEVDALYRRFGYTSTTSFNAMFFATDRERANSWEFPILVKHRLPGIVIHPFVEIGYAPRVMSGSGVIDITMIQLDPPTDFAHSNRHQSTNYDISHGLVIGAGLETTLAKLHILPEIRYTRWNNTPVNATSPIGSLGPPVVSTQNQVDILLGVTWH